jgi:hypothetical protein
MGQIRLWLGLLLVLLVLERPQRLEMIGVWDTSNDWVSY